VATALKDTSTDEIERRLDEIQPHGYGSQRSNVLTHVAWVPPEWSRAAARVLEGLGARHPSRTILLHPDPKASADRLDAEVEHDCFGEGDRLLCVEVINVWLRGGTAHAPASVVEPLQLPDLPAFLRWRGKPPFGRPEFDQLVGVSDRLIVDSSEWDAPRRAFARLADVFGRVAVSDLAWVRTLRWRIALAELWPETRSPRSLRVAGPEAEALLLAGWLRSRLRREIRLRREDAASLARVEVDGKAVTPARVPTLTRSELLSEQLDLYVRDSVYEAAVRAV
jgi:glucose-6-phosphate dehydrogenase assembly protein OpcA